jgi:katanin p80 WD40 repeat-containing subunit B1
MWPQVWDLEMQSQLESTPLEATGVRAMTFHPDGQHIFAALQDGLRVWQWEPSPAFQHDNVDIPWTKVCAC